MNEDKLTLAHAEDRIEQCRNYDMLTHTSFLDARQQSLVRRAFGVRSGDVRLVYDGGYEDADRVILAALPYYMADLYEESLSGEFGPVRELMTVIRATAPKGSLASRSGRALSRAADLFAHLPHCTAHKLRTNAKTQRRKHSRMRNLENHSQKGLYKCNGICYYSQAVQKHMGA